MKKIFKISLAFGALALFVFIYSCTKENVPISTNTNASSAPVDLQDELKRADAASTMFYNHIRYNLLTVNPEEYFKLPKILKSSIDEKLAKFNAETQGFDVQPKIKQLHSQKYLSDNEYASLSEEMKSLENVISDSVSTMRFIDDFQTNTIKNNSLKNEEKSKLICVNSFLKMYLKYNFENESRKGLDSYNKAKYRCLSQILCAAGIIVVGSVVGYIAGFQSVGVGAVLAGKIGAAAGAVTAAIGLILAAPICSCDPPPVTCQAPTNYSIQLDGNCSLSQNIYISGGLDEGTGYRSVTTGADPQVLDFYGNSYQITQSSNSDFNSGVQPHCQSQTNFFIRGNIYNLIHNAGSPSFIQGNSVPSAGSTETYFVLGDVNKPGTSIVANVNGSIGNVIIGSVTGQQGWAVQVNWFRSGSGSLDIQTRSSCGELSNKVSIPVNVQ